MKKSLLVMKNEYRRCIWCLLQLELEELHDLDPWLELIYSTANLKVFHMDTRALSTNYLEVLVRELLD
jgi:hypothetical protein